MPQPFSKRTTWFGLALLIVGTLVEVLMDPAVFAPLASLLGEQLAPKVGALVAVVGGVVTALGRALGELDVPADNTREDAP